MIDDELELLRGFRSAEAAPPPGLGARIEESVMQQVLAQEQARARRDRGWWRWRMPALARQTGFAVAAMLLVVTVSLNTGAEQDQQIARVTGTGSTTSAGVGGAAGVLDTVAERLLGTTRPDGAANPPPLSQPRLNPRELETYPVVPGYAGEPSLLAAGPASMTPQQMAQVPRDPRALLVAMRDATTGTYERDRDYGTFRVASYYLADPDVPLDLKASVLRMLAIVDGVRYEGVASDVLGRRGIVLARADRTSGIRQQYLVDADHGHILEQREFTTRPDVARPECPPFTIVALGVYDQHGFRVRPADSPYANWPQVRDDCVD